jgi:hypothetical protein
VPKGKKVKVLTHRSRYIEPAVVPKFGEGASSTAEAGQAALIMQSIEESTVVPKVPTVGRAEAKNDKAKEPQVETIKKMPEILSPQAETELPKVQKAPAATPKRRRMASVLDAILETTKALSLDLLRKMLKLPKSKLRPKLGLQRPLGQRLSRLKTKLVNKLQIST